MNSLFSPDEFGGQGDLHMADFDEEPAPEGKKWECCIACGGRGKVLVDDVTFIPRPRSVSVTPSVVGSDGMKRYIPCFLVIYFYLVYSDGELIVVLRRRNEEEITLLVLKGLFDA